MFFRSGDHSDMAAKISGLLSDRASAERVRLAGVGTAAKYTWQKIAPQIVKNALEL